MVQTTSRSTHIATAKAIAGEAWTSEQAYETLRDLCDRFGHRFAGSDGEKAAASFMAGFQTSTLSRSITSVGCEGPNGSRFLSRSAQKYDPLHYRTVPLEPSRPNSFRLAMAKLMDMPRLALRPAH